VIKIETQGRILHVINDNPDSRNALSMDYISGLHEQLCDIRLQTENRPHAVILSGAGDFFCSGGNVSDLHERAKGHYAARRALVDDLNDLIRAIRNCPCPVIAAIEGGAAGAGAAIALACDLIYAGRSAYLAASYVKIGLTPDAGTSLFLLAAVPRWLAAELLFTGRKISAGRLYDLGVVNQLVDDGRALEASFAAADELADGPPMAISRAKMLLTQAASTSFDAQLEAEADMLTRSLGGAEARAGIKAFLSRRKPEFPAG